MAKSYSRIVYVDGFAGPGKYKGGEPGSPIIALQVACEHPLLSKYDNEVAFLFIETDEERFKELNNQIGLISIPVKFKVNTQCDTFETCISGILDNITEQRKRLAPSFFFIDPFGPTEFSMNLVEKISQQKSSEVLINFSYQSMNQWFLQDPSKQNNLNVLFGNDNWKKVFEMDVKHKEEFLRLEYQSALEELGWKVRPFCMINKHNHTQFYLFFATKNPLGMMVMKNAMWKSAPSGDFRYSDLSNPAQGNMFEQEFEKQYIDELAKEIYVTHKGETVNKENLLNELAWHPICIKKHLTAALKSMEDNMQIIHVENRKKKGSYPDGCIITFANIMF